MTLEPVCGVYLKWSISGARKATTGHLMESTAMYCTDVRCTLARGDANSTRISVGGGNGVAVKAVHVVLFAHDCPSGRFLVALLAGKTATGGKRTTSR